MYAKYQISDRYFKRKGYDLTMFSQWLHTPVPPFEEFVDSFPSDGATRIATTKNGHALPRPTMHSRAWRNEQCTPYERFSSCTSHEVDEIECFIDKKLMS